MPFSNTLDNCVALVGFVFREDIPDLFANIYVQVSPNAIGKCLVHVAILTVGIKGENGVTGLIQEDAIISLAFL